MKELRGHFKELLARCAENDRMWAIVSKLLFVPRFLFQKRENEIQQRRRRTRRRLIRKHMKDLSPDLKVLSGPFAAMEYTDCQSFGSSFPPKILGTYEAELHDVIRDIIQEDYEVIINVGCGEGYYAIGLAREMPDVKVYAYDIDAEARQACRRMAEKNGVSKRVKIGGHFSLEELDNIDADGNGFLLCDCEGGEKDIFCPSEDNWGGLVQDFDLLIEVHEFMDLGLSDYLQGVFESTHSADIIQSIDDVFRPREITCPFLGGLTPDEKMRIMSEKRPTTMEWLYLVRLSQ